MDDFSMDQKALDQNLKELEVINRWLGGYAVSFSGLEQLNLPSDRVVDIWDLGCGGGDGMIAMQKFLERKGIQARMTGVDANPKALTYAKNRCKNHPDFEWICAPFQDLRGIEADVIHCSLFAHHFYGADLASLSRLLQDAKMGFVVNDLHRHWLAYHSISILTHLFSRSALVKNDARLSVAKGFSRAEVLEWIGPAPEMDIELVWKWAFRWQATGKNRGFYGN
jgi:2-polyprenyl-3-methyl-5-hydroxy-6-metoxy-1,4-benzoquinol methylase